MHINIIKIYTIPFEIQKMSHAYTFEILTGDAKMPENPVTTFPYECDNFQKHSFNAIEKNNNVIVNVPTSGGKTSVAIYAILHCIKIKNQKVAITTPQKSLSNEKYNEFTRLFTQYGITVGLLTGDDKKNPDADVIVCTAEILENSLTQLKEAREKNEDTKYDLSNDFLSKLGCVIMDEVHYMNDDERGKVWEMTIICLPEIVQLVMLSGTIGNKEEFADWICKCRKRNVSIIYESKRVIPLQHSIYIDKKLYQYIDNDNNYSQLNFLEAKKHYEERKKEREKKHKFFDSRADIVNLVNYLKDNNMMQAIMFSFSKDECEKNADMISNMMFLEQDEINRIEHYFQVEIMSQKTESGEFKYKNVAEIENLKKLLIRGIAYHHSGVLQNMRELIEILMREGLIKILFATETLCIGVNVPAKTTIFTGLHKFTNKGKRAIYTSEYRQMAGRAGRRGHDVSGNVIFLPLRDFPYEEEFKSIVCGIIPSIKSNFKLDYKTILRFALENKNIIDIFSKSLMNKQILSQILDCDEKISIYQKEYNDIVVEMPLNTNVLNLLELEEMTKVPNMKLTKKQEQEMKCLKNKIFADEKIKFTYESCKKKNILEIKLYDINVEKKSANEYITNIYTKFKKNMIDLGYLAEFSREKQFIEKDDILVKGLICSQINECNVMILTEMIDENYFANLTHQEICAIISLFSEPIKKDSEQNYYDCSGMGEFEICINKIKNKILFFEQLEKKNNLLLSNETLDFTLCYDYIDFAFEWSSGKSFIDIQAYLREYKITTEMFRKSMIKISNILLSLMSIYKYINKNIDVIPKLEKANKSILRGIVNTNSLYT